MPGSAGSKRVCPLCEREVPRVSRHHLIPRSRGGKPEDMLPICQDCHDAIHVMFTNKELEKEFCTVAALLSDERFQRHVKWLSRQDPGRRFRPRRARNQRRRGG